MKREEMIELLIMDRMWEWVFAHCYDSLQETLRSGFKGYDDYTDKELKEELESFGEEHVKELHRMVKNVHLQRNLVTNVTY